MDYDQLFSLFFTLNESLDVRTTQLQQDDIGVFASYEGMRLHSAFQPIVSLPDRKRYGCEALLRPYGRNGEALSPEFAFKRVTGHDQVVCFDRLCRMLHATNYFAQGGGNGYLFLNVSGRHLINVGGGYGATFTRMLKFCGLDPRQIVLEILESHVDRLDLLQQAVEGYREHGFRVALDDFGCQHSNFDRLWLLSPDIVKLDRSLIVQAVGQAKVRRILPKIVEIIHDIGALAICEGIEDEEQHRIATESGTDLVQGYFYGRPSRHLLPPSDEAKKGAGVAAGEKPARNLQRACLA